MTTSSSGLRSLKPMQEYQGFLDRGEFRIQRDKETGKAFFYPRVLAPGSGSQDLEWFEPSGRGIVYSSTVITQRPPNPDYNVVIVTLEEGPRVMSRVEGIAAEDVRIGMLVRARVEVNDEIGILLFDPLEP